MNTAHPQPDQRRVTWAVALAGLISFALMYGTQPVLPQIAGHFNVSPAQASLTVSASTLAMAVALIPLSVLADRFGRALLMRTGLLVAVVCAIASGLVSSLDALMLCRLGVGISVASVPAAALAHLGDETPASERAQAIGTYIAANAVGGMAGRLLTALVTQWSDWQWGLLAQGVAALVGLMVFWRLLPPPRQFVARRLALGRLGRNLRLLVADPVLPWLFALPFLAMGAFVGLYNYIGFLLSEQHGWPPAAVGLLFLLYSIGSVGSSWAGRLRLPKGNSRFMQQMCGLMLAGLLMTLWGHPVAIVAGVAVFTFSFFANHARASGTIGERAGKRRGLASALYLSSYYLGGSVVGSAAGWPWSHGGWPSVVAVLSTCVLGAWWVLRKSTA